MQPYLRQMILPEVGVAGQKALSRARVLIVGAGGLGTPAAQYLAAAGIGHLTLLDQDVVSDSNLHRQVLYRSQDLGRLKVQVLKERLSDQGLDSVRQQEIWAVPEMLTLSWGLENFSNYDLILDGTDNFAAKFLLNDLAIRFQLPLVTASVMKWEGQLMVYDPVHSPCYRCLFPDIPKGQIQNCAEAGVMGAVVGILGAWQALEAIKIILQKSTTGQENDLYVLRDDLMLFDFKSLQTMKLKRSRRPGCRCADKEKIKMDTQDYDRSEACNVQDEDPMLRSPQGTTGGAEVIWIDVREKEEWDSFHWPEAVHFPLSQIEQGRSPDWLPGKSYGLVCVSGARALRARAILGSSADGRALVLYPGSVFDQR